MMKKIELILSLLAVTTLVSVGCSEEEEDREPIVVGCDRIDYEDSMFFIDSCEHGADIVEWELTQNGHSTCFYITCANRCISTVEECGGS